MNQNRGGYRVVCILVSLLSFPVCIVNSLLSLGYLRLCSTVAVLYSSIESNRKVVLKCLKKITLR
jgi:hypothetical protein